MSRHWKALLDALMTFLVFFVLVAFVVTCCFFLFLRTMSDDMGLVLTAENVQLAAKLTFVNVLFLSLLFSAMDIVRRHVILKRQVAKILEATNEMASGNFSTQIPKFSKKDIYGFNAIAANLNHMARELSGIETLRTDFIANVSHELKTPLSVIQNYGTILQQPGLEEAERIEYAKTVSLTSRRLASLVTNILKLNKLENQQIFPHVEVYNLSEQLCQCLLLFEELWEKKNIRLDVEIPDEVMIRSDPDLLEHVWSNLLSNAMKFTPEGGSVSVSLVVEEKTAVVTVSDTGCGMTAEQGRHIFEKFYQADTSHATRGNGLGLALVKRVVDITGSSISVQSAPGKGSSFTVRLGGVP